MIAIIQRVKNARVTVGERVTGQIGKGMLILLGVAKDDSEADIDFMARKVSQMRIFEDSDGKMNLGAAEAKAEFLVVSQFTLLGDCLKGRRPSFDKAAEPKKAEEYYELFVRKLRGEGFKVETGEFRAMMDVALINDGPVTLVIDSKGVEGQRI
jgi:D-aminoacyl-tRNA deacylase